MGRDQPWKALQPCLDPACTGFEISLADYVAAAAQGGFSLAEVPATWLAAHVQEHGLASLADLFAAHGVVPVQFTCGLGVPGNVAVAADLFAARLADLPAFAQLARGIGCHYASLFCDPQAHEGVDISDAELIRRVVDLRRALRPAGVNLSLGLIGAELLARAGAIWEQIGDPGVGILVDTISLARAGLGVSWIERLPTGSIGWLRVADAPEGRLPGDLRYSDRLLPGTGRLPLAEMIGACRGNGYCGPVSVEVGEPGLASHPPARRASLAYRHTADVLATVGT